MKLDNSKQESSDLKVFGVAPKDSEIKSEFCSETLISEKSGFYFLWLSQSLLKKFWFRASSQAIKLLKIC